MQEDVFIPSSDMTTGKIAGAFYNPGANDYFIGLVDIDSEKMVWHSEPLGDGTISLIGNSNQVFAANDAQLMAYHTEDGTLAWQTEMSDSLGYSDVNLLVSPNRLITLTSDQTITAYDSESGIQVWSREQSAPGSTMQLMGDTLIVVDYIEGSYDDSLFFIDPNTGEQLEVITPVCDINGNSDHMDSSTGVVFDQIENSIFLIFDSGVCSTH